MPKCATLVFALLLFCALKAQLPALIPYNDHGKWGYADSNGVIKIKPKWNVVSFFYPNGLAWVESEIIIHDNRKILGTSMKRGIIDKTGDYIIAPNYALFDQKVTPETHYFYFYHAEGNYLLYDSFGKFICGNCVKGDSFFRLNRMVYYSSKRHKYCLNDLDGKRKSKRYDGLHLEETGNFSFYTYCRQIDLRDYHKLQQFNLNHPLWVGINNNKYFLIDSNGKEVYSWLSNRQKDFPLEYCHAVPINGVYFGGIKSHFPIQYPDSSDLFFSGSKEHQNCKVLYEKYSVDNYNSNENIKSQFRLSNFYLIDKYGRKYAKF